MTRLLISSGDGPMECRLAVGHLLRRLAEEAEAAGLDFASTEAQTPEAPASAAAALYGEGAEAFARLWLGTVLWTATSPVRPHHKRRNWFVGVYALPELAAAAALDPRDVRYESFRAGGPGGQHQNVTDSAVRAIHLPSGLSAVARDQRSQHRNRAAALARLGEILAARRELDEAASRREGWLLHKALERGAPVRRFRGPEFRPEPARA